MIYNNIKTRSRDEVFNYICNWVNCVLPCYPGKHQLMHYQADGRAELIDQRIKGFLLEEFSTKVTWSPTDTSDLGDIGLVRLPKSFSWGAHSTACNIVRMMPLRNSSGWMCVCQLGVHPPCQSFEDGRAKPKS